MRGSLASDVVSVSTKTLVTDIKAQLMFIPKEFNWTVGWRAYVWRDEETGQCKDLSEDEFKEFLENGTVNYTRDGGGSDTAGEPSTGTEGNPAE
jgi:hypothetical protein